MGNKKDKNGIIKSTGNFLWKDLVESQDNSSISSELGLNSLFKFTYGFINETEFSNYEKSILSYNESLAIKPDFIPSIICLLNNLLKQKSWHEIVQKIYNNIKVVEEKLKYPLMNILGITLESCLGQLNEADFIYNKLLTSMPDNKKILILIESSRVMQKKENNLKDIYSHLATLTTDERLKSYYLFREGKINEIYYNNIEEAIRNYQKGVSYNSDNPILNYTLIYLYEWNKNWNELIENLIKYADFVNEPFSSSKYYQIATIYQNKKQSEDKAKEYFEKVIKIDPHHILSYYYLEQIYEREKNWEELIKVEEILMDFCSEAKGKLGYHFKLANIYEDKIKDFDKAIYHYNKTLEIFPNYVPSFQALSRLYSQKNQWEELVHMHEYEAENSDEPQIISTSYYRAGEISEKNLKEISRALLCYQKALDSLASFMPAFTAIERIYINTSNWEALAELYEKQIEISTKKQFILSCLLHLGEIYDVKLSMTDEAIKIYKKILEIQPDNFTAMQSLTRLYEINEDWNNLINILKHEAEVSDENEKISMILHQCGEIAENKIKNEQMAIAFYYQVINQNPRYLPTITALGRLYAKLEKWQDLIEMYYKELEVTSIYYKKSVLYYKIGEIYHLRLNDDKRSIESYEQAIDLTPDYYPAMEAFERLCLQRGANEKLINLWSKRVNAIQDKVQKSVLYFRLGELEELNESPESALRYYLLAWEENPTFLQAIDSLERLYIKTGKWLSLIELYDVLLSTAKNVNQKLNYYFFLAYIVDYKIGNKKKAIEYYQKILELQPDNLIALYSMKTCYEYLGNNYAELIEIYKKLQEIIGDNEIHIALIEKSAFWFLTILNNKNNGIEILRNILNNKEDELDSLMFLTDFDLIKNDFKSGEKILEKWKNLFANDNLNYAAFSFVLAYFLYNNKDIDRALLILQEVVEKVPGFYPAWKIMKSIGEIKSDNKLVTLSLEVLAGLEKDSVKSSEMIYSVAKIYLEELKDIEKGIPLIRKSILLNPQKSEYLNYIKKIYEDKNDWKGLVEELSSIALQINDRKMTSEILAETAKIKFEKFSDRIGAISLYNKALTYSSHDDEILLSLVNLYFAEEQWNEVIVMLKRLLQISKNDENKIKAYLILAEVEYEKLGNIDNAQVHLNYILKVNPINIKALELISKIHITEQQWYEAEEVLLKLINSSEIATELKVNYYLSLADVQFKGLKDLDSAYNTLQKAWEKFIGNVDIIFKIKEIHEKKKDWKQIVEFYNSILNNKGIDLDNTVISQIYYELGLIYNDYLSDESAAIGNLLKAEQINPDNVEPSIKIGLIYKNNPEKLKNAELEFLRVFSLDPFRIDVVFNLVDIWKELGDADKYFCGLEYLNYFKAADSNKQNEYYNLRREKGNEAINTHLNMNMVERYILSNIEKSPNAKVLNILDEFLSRIYFNAQEELHNISYKIKEINTDILNNVLNRLNVLFKFDNNSYKIFESKNDKIDIIPDMPPLIIIPGMIEELSDKEKFFILSIPLFKVFSRTIGLQRLSTQELNKLLIASIREFISDYQYEDMDEGLIEILKKKIFKTISGKNKKIIGDYVKSSVLLTDFNVDNLINSNKKSSFKIGLLACGELGTVVDYIKRNEPNLVALPMDSTENMKYTLKQNEDIVEILKWFLSENHLQLRKMLKE